MTKSFRLCSLVLAMAILLAPAGFAQTTINTGAISGTVKDSSGSPLPGVTITVSSPRLQGTRTAVSDGDGGYTVPVLPPGTYTATYELSGIKTQTREGIIVSASQTTRTDVSMQMALAETVTVTADQVVVDTTQTQQQTTLKEDRLKYTSVSSANRSFQQAITQVPEAANGGNANVAGANINSNTFMIDGINALTDPVTHTFASNMVFDAIQEMNIVAFGKDAEFRSSGATINVITKSGGNNFSGSVDYRYSDPDFFTQTDKKYAAAPTYFGGPPNGNPTLRFDKSAVTDKTEQPQATLGGPIMRDKLWFFASAHNPKTSRIAPNIYGFQPGSRDFSGWNTLAKLTFTPFSNHTFAGRHTNSYATITNILFSSAAPTEADGYQTQHNKNLSFDYNGVLSSKWLVNAQVGHTPASLAVAPMSNDESLIRFSDLNTGIIGGNYSNAQGRESTRDELILSTTYYVEAFGSHAFKAGVSIDKSKFDSYNYTTGDPSKLAGLPADACARSLGTTALRCGVTYTIRNGVPVTATLTPVNPVAGAEMEGRSFYIQDQWNPIAPLTIRAGLRYDNVDFSSSKPVPSFKLLQPRLGIAYDLFNNGGTVIHAYGGKIMDENQLTLPNNLNTRYSGNAVWTYNASTQQYAFTRTTVSPSGLDVDPGLDAPFSNEYSLGFTQRLFTNTSIDITAERRTGHNNFALYAGSHNPATPNDFSGLLPTAIFTACPAGQCNIVRSEFEAIVAKIDTRPTRNSDLSISWTHGESKGSTGNDNAAGQNVSGAFNYFPYNFENYYGFVPDDAADRVKVNGFYRLPWEFTVGASYNWDSGTPYTVFYSHPSGFGSVFLEERGSRRLPHFHQLDMQVQKDFTIGPVKAGLIASVLNVLNTEIPLGINGNAGTRAIVGPDGKLFIDPDQQAGANRLSPTFQRYTSFQRPRRFEAGVRFEF